MKEEEKENSVSEYLFNLMNNYSDSVIPSFSQLTPEINFIKQLSEKEEEIMKQDVSDYLSDLINNYSATLNPSHSQLIPDINIKQNEGGDESHYKLFSLDACESSLKAHLDDRRRRRSMNHFYTTLQSIVPNLTLKETKTCIVSGTIEYIKQLEGLVKELESKKKEIETTTTTMLTYTTQDSNMDVVVSGEMVILGIYLKIGRGLVTKVLMVFEEYRVEVLAANVSVNGNVIKLTVTALINGNGRDLSIELIKAEIIRLVSSE
ncbi:hypothetical protein FRX31_008344 [Thalictrum thalictroides]|uniref:BHLH domain-containing protein n=1 Tax=Thalictrum thalictroides TaxID=46969 RepID=A0A7J6WXA3_THATH|nr:hypothetical protein FRX31_008344 [Thalictrum thalictroides]